MKSPFHGVARTLTIHILAIDQGKFNSVFSRLEIASKQIVFLTMPSYPEKMGAESCDSRVSLWALKRVRWWLGDKALSLDRRDCLGNLCNQIRVVTALMNAFQ